MNLSSSDEEEDYNYSSNDDDIKGILHSVQRSKQKTSDAKLLSSVSSPIGATAGHSDNNEYNRSDSDEFEDIDWEDASVHSNNDNQQDHKLDVPVPVAAASTLSHRIFPTKDVIVHWEDPQESSSDKKNANAGVAKGKMKNQRRMNKIRNIPNHMQRFIRNLHRTHMLCMISRGMFLSGCTLGSMEEEIWSIAHSLIPSEFVFEEDEEQSVANVFENEFVKVPCLKKVRKFCTWFFDLVNNVVQRRNEAYASNIAAGAPRMRRTRKSNSRTSTNSNKRRQSSTPKEVSSHSASSTKINNHDNYWNQRLKDVMEYLSPTNDDNPQQYEGGNYLADMTITPIDKVILFICLTRSLKWRVRLVLSIDPMTQELTVDHPLFHSTMMGTFQCIAKTIEKHSMRNQAGKKRKRSRNNRQHAVSTTKTNPPVLPINAMSSYNGNESHQDFIWAEVLCQKTTSASKGDATNTTSSHHRWVHVDPTLSLFDEPMKVEMIDVETHSLKEGKNRNKLIKPVSYVVGIENFHDLPEMSSSTGCTVSQWLRSTTKVTDITPRYANKWSVTLKIRGANSKSIAQGKCTNDWWRHTLQQINHAFVKKRAEFGLSKICMDGSRSCKKSKHTKLNHRHISSSSPSFKVETESRGNKKVDVLVIDDDDDDDDNAEEESSAFNGASQGGTNHEQHDLEQIEQSELEFIKGQEAIPTSKAAFKNHPLYVIPSIMKKQEVLAPDAKKRICGIFKGEMVFKRSDVSMAWPAKKWLYQGRKVVEKELANPAKIIKARKKPAPKGFQALSTYGTTLGKQEDILKDDGGNSLQSEDDGNTKLYGFWQTKRWSPPYVGPNEPIPVNEHKNVELALLNPGLAHVELYRIAKVAKQLGIPYAPCLVGFEGHGGNRTPTIRGIVVHGHNVDLLNEAHVEMQSQLVEQEVKERQQAIYGRWRRLIKGILTRDRIAREYAND